LSHIEVVRAAVLKDVAHGFLGRSGGVSEGVVAGLNVGWGSGDDREAIGENRRRAVAAVLPGARLVTLHQIHSSTIVVAGDWPDENRPFADGLVTDRPGVLLGILTADCAPVLLADAQAGVVGAAHSGWRGAVAGVNEATVAAMEKLGARRERITAAIGPAIAARSYEVDPSFRVLLVSYYPTGRRTSRISTWRPMSPSASPRRGSRPSRRWASTPIHCRSATSVIAAPPIAASPTTAARSA